MSVKIFSIGAGKGGIGKSFFTASLGVTLAKQNHSVLVVDLDFSGANLHTHLGCNPNSPTIHSYFVGQNNLVNLIRPTNVPHLSYIQGFWDEWDHFQVEEKHIKKLVTDAKKLPFDFVLFDLGPGHSKINLELFALSDEKILISSPEPTSIEKTYRFIEHWIYKNISTSATTEAKSKLHSAIKEFRAMKKHGHFSFRNYLENATGLSFDHFEEFKQNPMHIVLNSVRSQQEEILGHSIKSVCKKYFDLNIDYLGHISFDNAVWHSIRDQEIFLIEKPYTPISTQLSDIAKSLESNEMDAIPFRAVV